MRIYRGFGALPAGFGPSVAAMGNFDGVHRGHRAVLAGTVASARARGALAVAVTFHPHPLAILAPERAPALLQSLSDRLEALEASGLDAVVAVPFTRVLAEVAADDFVADCLLRRLRCVELRVGADARFGRGRAGDVDLLRRYAERGAFALDVAGTVAFSGTRVSSSEIRRRVLAGDVAGARDLLGHPFSLCGEVVTGAARGRKMGFPTANVLPDVAIRPAPGIYAARGEVEQGAWPAAVHVGPVPTFGVAEPVVEAHLVGFDGDLVGRRLRLSFLRRLRGIESFPGMEALAARIAEDVAATLAVLRDDPEGIR